ncbi:MAG: helix-turn-helix domain-containing protein [Candidatus Thiodiazotropha sp.]
MSEELSTYLSVEDIFSRTMQASGLNTDASLAHELGVTPQAIANARKRNKVPFEKLVVFSKKKGISLDYLFYGNSPSEEKLLDLDIWNDIALTVAMLRMAWIEENEEAENFWFSRFLGKKLNENEEKKLDEDTINSITEKSIEFTHDLRVAANIYNETSTIKDNDKRNEAIFASAKAYAMLVSSPRLLKKMDDIYGKNS